MKRLLLALLLFPSLASAQSVSIHIDLPVVLPKLVVVSPGVQVVPEVDEEVFLVDGWYWCRHDGGWYRSRSHRDGWALMPPRAVPARLVEIPEGRYRRWMPPGQAKKMERRERMERGDGDDKGHGHGRGRGHGHGHDED